MRDHDEERDMSLVSATENGVDLSRPNPARMYDYYLGGVHNFAVDRKAAADVLAILPETRDFALQNRAFLRRVVRYLVREAGVVQFLDLGSGIPTVGNVHEIAQDVNPDCRVVYVDHEPVAVAHSRKLLRDNDNAAIVQADIQDTDTVLSHPDTRRLLDFDQPVAVLMLQVLPFVPDADDPGAIIGTYRSACAPGSFLALAHSLTPEFWPGAVDQAIELYRRSTHPLHLRTPEQVEALFDGYDLVPPGVVFTAAWRPDHPISQQEAISSRAVAGLGRLPLR
ncbi:S-adenosyl methyltransferase [Streptoalloteichus tenebrarius]|uniref:S-adenosyl methyltransferase n=2 Tax=Streptoalloteichus tenebrarius (strain ATCC 17920 / DSM 40477 / JCM 4838 / CBS 697.72 / NBRC 16177 / NCIMB 11028 / NRRL B-12390 / A12253. 1 / ISP 5477) TaxID=1933 RepID=A0ABT1HRW7_STRSD|nr:SAM-dependent methyltransferase [Streptoalloteichus tenebrarius]MCP2258218.1 S-adenosyl methyltransferase [Streptoalloteichus tenebrarius]